MAVVINACFVVYQGWVSSALSPFSCQLLDDGQLDPTIPSDLAYYADFQRVRHCCGKALWQGAVSRCCVKALCPLHSASRHCVQAL